MRIKNSHYLFKISADAINISTKKCHKVIHQDVFMYREMIGFCEKRNPQESTHKLLGATVGIMSKKG
jgi:hypothetical protein